MAACDHCYDGIIQFCHLGETAEGSKLQAELIETYRLEGLFPCEHPTYSEWADWYNHWKDDMMRYFRTNEQRETGSD